jgi:hypothetical protein
MAIITPGSIVARIPADVRVSPRIAIDALRDDSAPVVCVHDGYRLLDQPT